LDQPLRVPHTIHYAHTSRHLRHLHSFPTRRSSDLAYNPHADPAALIEQLGERYEILRTNIKKWPVGSPIQAALDALEILREQREDRKSTRLNSSHVSISYAGFCLKKKQYRLER